MHQTRITLVSLIIGDNPQGYGQDMVLLGRKKGSGESIWDIKRQIGYFTPAMVKHPPILILDEPTIELDEENSVLFIEMVNAIKSEKNVAIIYVSHRDDQNLQPDKIFELVPTDQGYTGVMVK